MNLFFLFNNLHFAIEIFGALAFLIAAWLAFDAFRIRSSALGAGRVVGFGLLAIGQVIHAFSFGTDVASYLAALGQLAGAAFVLASVAGEVFGQQALARAIVVLPGFAAFSAIGSAILGLAYGATGFLSFRQYRRESKKDLRPFWMAFALLAAGALILVASPPEALGPAWLVGHAAELAGFAALIWWVWQYLSLRIREELVLISVSAALLISIVVTLAFSLILVRQIETGLERQLLTNARVLDFAVARLQETALAKAKLLADRDDIAAALAKKDFAALETLLTRALDAEELGFLTLVDAEGEVVLRAHALTRREDRLSGERAVRSALAGTPLVTIETSPAEQFSIRAAAPIAAARGGAGRPSVEGAIVAGYPLDNALVDQIKRITGLEMSIYAADTRVASTALHPDGRTRSTGVRLTDDRVRNAVLGAGEVLTVRTTIHSRPFLASFLPLRDAEGAIVGMLSASKPQQEVVDVANAANRLTIVTVMAIMLVLAAPISLMARRFGATAAS